MVILLKQLQQNLIFFKLIMCVGSIPIESIMEEFIRQQSDIGEIQNFLSLPQHKPLREQLNEAGELMSGETVIIELFSLSLVPLYKIRYLCWCMYLFPYFHF